MADFGDTFEQKSGGAFKTKDFEAALNKVAAIQAKLADSGNTLLTQQEQYEAVIKKQVGMHNTRIKWDTRKLNNEKKRLGIFKAMLPWQNKELRFLKEKIKGEKEAATLLKRHNTAMGFALSGLKKGASGAAAGIGKMVGKLGALGAGLISIKKLVDEFLKVNKFIADVSKQFGISSKAATAYTKVLAGAEENTAKFLLNMQELNEVATELVMQMGGLHNITSEAVEVSGKLQKAFGLTAKQAADLFTTMHLNMGMTASQVEEANASMQQFAEKNGAVASLVMRDLASSAALTAMSMGKSMESVGAMSIKAQKLGTSFEALKEGGKRFILDFEGSSESIAKINNMLGTNMRADMMAINAESGRFLENQYLILDAVDKYQASGRTSTLIEAELEQFGGARMDDLIRMAKLRKEGNLDLKKEYNQRKKLDDLLRDAMDIWQRIKGVVMGAIQPVLTKISILLNDQIGDGMSTIETSMKNWGAGMGEAFDKAEGIGGKIKALIVYITKPFATMFAEALQYAWDNLKLFKGDGKAAGSHMDASQGTVPGMMVVDGKFVPIPKAAAATGNVFNSPHMALVGEEGRSEVVIPTERIRKGLPVSGSVAKELGSIGVPGYALGGSTTRDNIAGQYAASSIRQRTEANAMYAAASDPLSIRRRTRDFETAANTHREELRRMHRREHEQQMTVLERDEENTRQFSVAMGGYRSSIGVNTKSSASFGATYANEMYRGGIETLSNIGKDLLNQFSLGQFEVHSKLLGIAGRAYGVYQQARAVYKGGRAAYKEGGAAGLTRFGLQTQGGQRLLGGLSRRNTTYQSRRQGILDQASINQSIGMRGRQVAGGYHAGMGETRGVAKGSAVGGIQAGVDTLMNGGSLKDAAIAGAGSFASSMVGHGATVGLMAMGVPAPLAQIAGSAVGQVVIGGAMKALGVGGWKKADKRKKAMMGFKKAVHGKDLMSFRNSGALLKSIMTPEGKIDEGSKRKTMTEMGTILSAAGMKTTPSDVESLMWAMIGLGNAEVAQQLPQSPQSTISHFQQELTESTGSAPTSSSAISGGSARQAAGVRLGGGGGAGGAGAVPGVGSADAAWAASMGGSTDQQAAMLQELRAMRTEMASRNTDIRVDMNGREVARLVTEEQEGLALG
jgi:hypothetical protein